MKKKWDSAGTIIPNGYYIKSKKHTYTIEKIFNQGASITYLAKRNDNQKIFLKQIFSPNKNSKNWKKMVKIQYDIFDILKSLNSIYIEENLEYFIYGDYFFQAKKFEKNAVSLDKIIWGDDEFFSNFENRLNLIFLITASIRFIHDNFIIHSDLKPEQFLVIKDSSIKFGFRIKLIDFDHCVCPNKNINYVAGTPGWFSPEHVKNQKVSFYSDIFTLGEIIYSILTYGYEPFKLSIENDTYENDIKYKKNYIPINEKMKDIFGIDENILPIKMAEVIDSMLEPDFRKRPDAKEVFEIFRQAVIDKKIDHLELIYSNNNDKIVIINNEEIGREKIKNHFKNNVYNSFYARQFRIIKDSKNRWFIEGFPVPSKAYDDYGNEYYFYDTIFNNENITNKLVEIKENSKLQIGNEIFYLNVIKK